MTEWHDIASAPKDGTEVLLYCAESRDYDIGHWEDGWFGCGWFGRSFVPSSPHDQPTHWAPLPSPPEPPQ